MKSNDSTDKSPCVATDRSNVVLDINIRLQSRLQVIVYHSVLGGLQSLFFIFQYLGLIIYSVVKPPQYPT